MSDLREQQTRWTWTPARPRGVAPAADKSGPKTSCGRNSAFALIGADGGETGGLRPFPGFTLVRSLDFEATYGADHDKTSRVTDNFPIDLRQGSGNYIYGFCYRVTRKTSTTVADVMVEWYNPANTTWTVSRIMSAVSATARMSVSVVGRVLYAFVEATAPQYFLVTGTGPYTVVNGDAGPGTQPTCTITGGSPSAGNGYVQFAGTGAVLPAGRYAVAYELKSSATGRRSGLSQICEVDATAMGGSTAIKIVVNPSAGYDRAYIYRSLEIVDAGGTYIGAILHLDSIVTLAGATDCPFLLTDVPLASQEPYLSRQVFDKQLPYGGASCVLDGCLIVGSISGTPASQGGGGPNQSNDEIRNVGEIRWSTPQEFGPELFSPLARYVPQVPSNNVIAMARLGTVAVGLSQDRAYHIRRSTSFIRVEELHEGYGIVSNKAVTTMADSLYWMSPRGVQAMTADGQLDDVRAVDWIVRSEWQSDLANVSMASDPESGFVVGMSPLLGRAFFLWLKTGMVTELRDLPFTEVRTGAWPVDWDDSSDAGNPLTRRALWTQNFPSGFTPPAGWKPRVFTADTKRRRFIAGSGQAPANAQPRIRLMDVNADACFLTTGTAAGSTVTVSLTGRAGPTQSEGSKLYVAESSTASFVGVGVTILGYSAGVFTLAVSSLNGLPAGSRVVVSPVLVRWEGPCLGAGSPEDDDGFSEKGFHRVRHVEAVVAEFEDVQGPAVTLTDPSTGWWSNWMMRTWTANDTVSTQQAQAKDPSTGETRRITEGSSPVGASVGGTGDYVGRSGASGHALGISVETFLVDLDYRLVSVRASGRIGAAERASRP